MSFALTMAIGVFSSLLVEVGKRLANKFGANIEKELILLFIFLIAVGSNLVMHNANAMAFVSGLWAQFSSACGIYALILSYLPATVLNVPTVPPPAITPNSTTTAAGPVPTAPASPQGAAQ